MAQNLTANQLLELSKKKKREKAHEEERKILEEALKSSPKNIKILNQYYRNLRRTGTLKEIKEILNLIYSIKPSGKIIQELIRIAHIEKDRETEEMLLREKDKLEPTNKKNKRKMKKLGILELPKEKEKKSLLPPIEENDYKLILEAREIIYTGLPFEDKKNSIMELLINQGEEIIIAVLAELYKKEQSIDASRRFIKEYKRGVTGDKDKEKLANILFELVTSKKTFLSNWNGFWLDNKNIINISTIRK